MIAISLDNSGETCTIRPTEYLGSNFNAYRNACSQVGAQYKPREECNRLTVDNIPQLLSVFDAAGLVAEVDSRIATLLADEANEAVRMLEEGRERVAACDKRLEGTGYALYDYQRTGVEWLAPRKGALLTDEMGLGKTVQGLVAAPDRGGILVACPKAVFTNWQDEAKLWRPDLKIGTIKNKSSFRWPRPDEILIVTEGCMPEIEEVKEGLGLVDMGLTMAPTGMTLIGDEAHAYKNKKAARTKKFAMLATYVRASHGRVWEITGTPILNRPTELWTLMTHAGVAEQCFGSYQDFVRAFRICKAESGVNWGTPSEQIPDMLRKVMLRRNRVDVLKDLPRKQRTDTIVHSISPTTTKYLDSVVAKMAERGLELGELELAADDVGKDRSIPFEMMSRTMSVLATAMTPAMTERVEQYEDEGIPLIVASTHRVPIDTLHDRAGWATITGDTSAEARGQIVKAFQAGELKGIAGTYQAMGVGITLTHASHVLLVGAPWTPALISQMEDRACRIGQEADSVHIERLLVNHPLHIRLVELLTIKQELIEATVEAAGVDADYLGESPAERLATAAEAAKALAVDLADKKAARDADASSARQEMAARIGATIDDYDGRPLDVSHDGRFRSAGSPREDWAAKGLPMISAGYDASFASSLSDQLSRNGRLSERQWGAAIRLVNSHRTQIVKQIGTMPVAQAEPVKVAPAKAFNFDTDMPF